MIRVRVSRREFWLLAFSSARAVVRIGEPHPTFKQVELVPHSTTLPGDRFHGPWQDNERDRRFWVVQASKWRRARPQRRQLELHLCETVSTLNRHQPHFGTFGLVCKSKPIILIRSQDLVAGLLAVRDVHFKVLQTQTVCL